MRKPKAVHLVLLSAGILVAAAVAWSVLGRPTEAGAPGSGGRDRTPLVEVREARMGDIVLTLERSGEVVATESVVIAATKEGPINYGPWREGDEVGAGDRLVEIDREVHRAEAETARAALSVARARLADLRAGARREEIEKARAGVKRWEATLQEARETYRRQMDLIAGDFTSRQSVDQARERMEVAEAELASARQSLAMLEAGPTATEVAVQEAAVEEASARLTQAEAHLAECIVRAPFDGRITAVHVRPGDLAVPRNPLVEMFDPASLVVRFNVPEAHAAAVRPGLRVEVTLDALPGRTYAGEVVRAYPRLDQATRTRTVEARLEGVGAELMPHQFARLKLELDAVEDAVLVPPEAVLQTPEGEDVVFLVEDGKAARRRVEIGVEQRTGVQILSGVRPGAEVITRGHEGLRDGAPVRLAGEEGAGRGEGREDGR